MKLKNAMRWMTSRMTGRTLREQYWAISRLAGELHRARRSANPRFWEVVKGDFLAYTSDSIAPIAGEGEERARAAVDWLLRAQARSPDDGVSLGYFPCDGDTTSGWRRSYPETTGYIITSLLAYAQSCGDEAYRAAAIRMGDWEAKVQMGSGAVQGGTICPPEHQTPAAFNTGMVLDGWCSLIERAGISRFMRPARAAADFLINDLDSDGYFRTNGQFVSAGEVKTYTCLCAWAIYRFGTICAERSYQTAAIRSIEAALKQQRSNGWFAHNCLSQSEFPLTHTLGYTLQGILEVGCLAGRDDFVASVKTTVDHLVPNIRTNGYLAGRFRSDWSEASLSSCLTGSAQIAIVAYRLAELESQPCYRLAADRLLNFLKSLQQLNTGNTGVDGAIAGSFPIFGEYMRGGYPNWATKYFLDALLWQMRAPDAQRSTPEFHNS